MNRLADSILIEIEKNGCTSTYFADLCGISRNELGGIVGRRKKDIRVSTVLKICKNSSICVCELFDCKGGYDLSNFIFTDGRERYKLQKF